MKPIINLIKRLSVYKMYPPKQGKSVIQLLAAVGITLMTATASFAEAMFPSNLWNKRGSSTSQSLEVLHVNDQHGSDDNFDRYIEFNSDQDGYVGDFRFNLPAMPDKVIQKLIWTACPKGDFSWGSARVVNSSSRIYMEKNFVSR